MGCVSRDSHHRKSVRDQITPSNSPRVRGTEQKFGRKGPSRGVSVNLMSVVHAHPGLRGGHKTKHRTKKDAPADLAKNVYKLKNADNVNTTPRRIWTSKPRNTSQQTSMAKSESTVLKIQWKSRTSWSQQQDGNCTHLPLHQVSHQHGGHQQMSGGKHRAEEVTKISLTSNDDSLWPTGGVNTTLPLCTLAHSAHVNFSRVAQDKHGVSSKVIFTSSTPCPMRSCFDVTCTSHSFSIPTSTSFERRWTHYSATWATLWPSGWEKHSYRLWAQRSHWSQRYGGFTDVLPQTEHDVDSWFSWEHCCSSSWIGFGWSANSGYAGFTTVLAYRREREKQVPSQESHLRQSRRCLGASSSPKGISCCHREKLTQWSKNAEQILPNALFANLKNPIQSNRMEIDHTNLGYEQSRREQVRLHEESAQRERALREIHVRNVHEVEELKRLQEMRIDECSKQELRESQTTKIELTSQIQELQDRVSFMNDSREFQAVESSWSGGLSHVPSQPAVVPSLRGMLSRNQSLRPDMRNSLATSGNVFDNPSAPVNSVSTSPTVKHPWNLDAAFGNPVQSSTGRPVARSEGQK